MHLQYIRCAAAGRERGDPGLKSSVRSKAAANPNLKTVATLGSMLPHDIAATADVDFVENAARVAGAGLQFREHEAATSRGRAAKFKQDDHETSEPVNIQKPQFDSAACIANHPLGSAH
jgi:hypothetical protein